MAPEVMFEFLYDSKCDMWSCGVILFILLCGIFPYQIVTINALKVFYKNNPYSYTKIPQYKRLRPEAKDLIRKLMHVDPKKRVSAD